MNKLNISDFIYKANVKHLNKYDYSKVIYISGKLKVIITCPLHGDFEQAPSLHLINGGCKKCANINRALSKSFKIEDYIKICNKKHNNKYNYSKTIIKNLNDKIIIICPIHGEFKQIAGTHKQGAECKKCGIIKFSKANTFDTKYFIEKASKIHDNKYDYSKSSYINNTTRLEIICPIHGSFFKTPVSHYSGNACSVCNKSKNELKICNWLSYYNIKFEEQKKFIDCINIKPLPFDFYLPDYNLLIEYQGEQHFKEIKYFKGDLEKRQRLDLIKKNYALNNNYNFLEITYKDNTNEKLYNYFRFMKTLDIKIDHNIPDGVFKENVSNTARLIRYAGQEYLDKLNKLNSEYEFIGVNSLSEREYAEKINLEKEKISEREYSSAQL